jgi:hypothetical protein
VGAQDPVGLIGCSTARAATIIHQASVSFSHRTPFAIDCHSPLHALITTAFLDGAHRLPCRRCRENPGTQDAVLSACSSGVGNILAWQLLPRLLSLRSVNYLSLISNPQVLQFTKLRQPRRICTPILFCTRRWKRNGVAAQSLSAIAVQPWPALGL